MYRRQFLGLLAGSAAATLLPGIGLGRERLGTEFTVDATATLGRVSPLATGVNILADRDRLDGTFPRRALSLGPRVMRWPGGTIAETQLRLNNPNNPQFLTDLRAFLRFCGANGITPTIVLPTKRYVGAPRRMVREIGEFVRRVTSGEFGGPRIAIWEIGNEFYVQPAISPEDYARVARRMIRVIRQNQHYRARIALQPGPCTRLIEESARAIRAVVNPRMVDLLIMHSYPRNDNIYTVHHFDTASRIFGGKPFYVSEWNIHSCWNPEFEFRAGNCVSVDEFFFRSFGLSQAGAMVEHFGQMVRRDIFAATGWAVQQNNMTSYFRNEGVGTDAPLVGGRTFGWLSQTAGMRLVGAHQSRGETDIQVNAFARDERRMEIFVYARGARTQSIDIQVQGFRFSRYWGQRLYGASHERFVVPAAAPAEALRFGNRLVVPVRLNTPHELVRLTLQA